MINHSTLVHQKYRRFTQFLAACFVFLIISCSPTESYDIIIRNGHIINGSGEAGFDGDIGMNDDTIAFIGNLKKSAW